MITRDCIVASSNDGVFRLIGAVVVLIIWGASAMASTIKKAQAEAKKKQARMPLAPSMPRPAVRPVPLPRLAPRTSIALPPLPTLRQAPAKPPAAIARPAPKAIPVTQPAAVMKRGSINSAAVPIPPVAQVAIPTLLRPTTVRAQFILAEVLQPPLALRTRRNL